MSVVYQSIYEAGVARLRKQFTDPRQADIAVAAFSEGMTVVPDAPAPRPAPAPAPTHTTSPARTQGKERAMAHIEADIREVILLTGVSRTEAARRVAIANGTLVVEDMTLTELEAYSKTVEVPDAWDPSRANQPQDSTPEEQADADRLAAEAATDRASHVSWAEGLHERVTGKPARANAARDAAYSDMKAKLTSIGYEGDIEAAAKSEGESAAANILATGTARE